MDQRCILAGKGEHRLALERRKNLIIRCPEEFKKRFVHIGMKLIINRIINLTNIENRAIIGQDQKHFNKEK